MKIEDEVIGLIKSTMMIQVVRQSSTDQSM